ncbi:hypothetical protein Taro_021278 [Colocasia esculenta]|uniref:Uncharacterized protein n=1 Tax=Colocasia esculenta TaxID=4460 RepID=A0A843UYK0_COLES|nr:hypothetical protein [Colocasia esculenta]
MQSKNIDYTRNYPCSDLLSTGVLCPVPEQQLRLSLPKGTVPLMNLYTPSHNWSSLHNSKRTYTTLDTTRSSFYSKGTHTLKSM